MSYRDRIVIADYPVLFVSQPKNNENHLDSSCYFEVSYIPNTITGDV
jgi:hypothetical protein